MIRLFLQVCLFTILTADLSGISKADLVSFPKTTSFLPRNWQKSPISAKITPLPNESRGRAEAIIEKALSKYPDSVVRKTLKGVRLVAALEFYGIQYGGTYMPHSHLIVLAYDPRFDDTGFEQRFHHEFSSVLLQAYENKFDDRRWKDANSPGFKYRSNGVIENPLGGQSEATKFLGEEQKRTGGDGSSLLELDGNLMALGFLTRYNQVSVEQDVNETAAHLFTNPKIWEYCSRFPRIDQKIDVLIDFYSNIDPTLNRMHFRKITAR